MTESAPPTDPNNTEQTEAPEPKKKINVMELIRKFNAYYDHIDAFDENKNPIIRSTEGIPVCAVGANIEERMAQLFSKPYRQYNTTFLGYQSYESPEDLEEDDSLTDYQKVNSQFMVCMGKQRDEHLFSVVKFHHRPMFCGVNVLYEPTLKSEFNTARRPVEYFKEKWDAENYENTKYNGKDADAVDCRDLCFNPTFLGDLQKLANNEPVLKMVFVRKGFSVGIGAVSSDNLENPDSIIPPMYGRVFENKWREKVVAYSPVMLETNVKRSIPVVVEDGTEITQKIELAANNNCYFAAPCIKDDSGAVKEYATVESVAISQPSIVFVGEEIEGYSLISYINIPVCSWTYFKSKESGFGSGDNNNQTKVVERLKNTQQCGPFMRVKAKDYYPAEVTEVLLGFATIKVQIDESEDYKTKNPDAAPVKPYGFEPVTANNQVVWGPPEGELSKSIIDVAKKIWSERESTNKTIRCEEYESENEATTNRKVLYEKSYDRNDKNNATKTPKEVKALFDEVNLPLRFAFFIIPSGKTVCIAQFPCMPLKGVEALKDDYVTQLVPLYRKITEDTTSSGDESTTEKTWYINDFDILVNRGTNGKRRFYKVNKQKPTLVTYPAEDSDGSSNLGYMYTCNGIVYRGPSYIQLPDEDKADYGNYLKIDDKWVQMVQGADYKDYKDSPQYKKAAYVPDKIQGIVLSKPSTGDYIAGPMGIAPYNYLDFMEHSTQSNNAKLSREAYKQFIKDGCVFMDGETKQTKNNPVDEPSRDPAEFISDECGFVYNGEQVESIEPEVEEGGGVPEEPKKPQWVKTVKIVVVVVLALISVGVLVFITYKLVKVFKGGNTAGIKCPQMASFDPKSFK